MSDQPAVPPDTLTPKLVIHLKKDPDDARSYLASVPLGTRQVAAYTQRVAVNDAIVVFLEQASRDVALYGLDRYPALRALFRVERAAGLPEEG